MRSFSTTILLCACTCGMVASGQTTTLSFTAGYLGTHVPLDSIRVEDLTLGSDTMLHGLDTALVLTDIALSINAHAAPGTDALLLTNHPNPFTGSTKLDLVLPEAGTVDLRVFDAYGRSLIAHTEAEEAGSHAYQLNLGQPGIYYVLAEAGNRRGFVKVIQVGESGGSAASINHISSAPIPVGMLRSSTGFDWMPGDAIRATGFASTAVVPLLTDTVLDSPSSDMLYVFTMLAGDGASSIQAMQPGYFPWEVARYALLNTSSPDSSYSGTFDGQPMQIQVTGEVLTFWVPDVPPGTYNITAQLTGGQFSATCTVNAAPVAQTADYYVTEVLDQMSSVTAALNILLDSLGNDPAVTLISQDNDRSVLAADSIMGVVNGFTPQEKESFVKVMAANEHLLLEYAAAIDDLLATLNSTQHSPVLDHEDQWKVAAYKFIHASVVAMVSIAPVAVAINAAIFSPPPLDLVAATGAALMLHDLLQKVKAAVAAMKDLLTTSFLPYTDVTTDTQEYEGNYVAPVTVEINYRTLEEEDLYYPHTTFIQQLVHTMGVLHDKVNSLFARLPGNSQESFVPPSLQGVTTYQSVTHAVYNAWLHVTHNTSDPQVVVQQIANADGSTALQFQNNTGQTRTVQYTITYSNPDLGTRTTNLTATVHPPVFSLVATTDFNTSQIVWNTQHVYLTPSGGVPPYQYRYFQCDQWVSDSTIDLTNAPLQDNCGYSNFMYGGPYWVRVRDSQGDTAGCYAFIEREYATVTSSDFCDTITTNGPRIRYASTLDFTCTGGACFNGTLTPAFKAYIIQASFPAFIDSWGGLNNVNGVSNADWTSIASLPFGDPSQPSSDHMAGLLVYGLAQPCYGILLTSINFSNIMGTNGYGGCGSFAACIYRLRLPYSTTRYFWSNEISHAW